MVESSVWPVSCFPMKLAKRKLTSFTSLSAVKDRLFTPLSPLNQNRPSAGVEIHAQAFETLASGRIMQPAGDAIPLLLSLLAAGAMASFFAFLRTRWAYSAGLVLLILILLDVAGKLTASRASAKKTSSP